MASDSGVLSHGARVAATLETELPTIDTEHRDVGVLHR